MFAVCGSRDFFMEFGVLGRSTGSAVRLLGADRLVLLSRGPPASRRITLENTSAVTACYQLDAGGEQGVFSLDKPAGHIPPGQQESLTLGFRPPGSGIFSRRLTCLLLHQCPISLEVVGVCVLSEKACLKGVLYERYSEPERGDGCGLCPRDGDPPPLRLAPDCLQFEPGDGGPRTVTVTNVMQEEVVLEWDKARTSISSQHSAQFEVRFTPHAPCLLYGAQLGATARWGDTRRCFERAVADRHLHVPVHATVSAIGHSFTSGTSTWAPGCEVCPTTLVMPPCQPPGLVYSSLLLRRTGHLPVAFRFVPPADSVFSVRPSQGLVRGSFQIVAVRMCPELHGEAVYCEDWRLQFNHCPRHEVIAPTSTLVVALPHEVAAGDAVSQVTVHLQGSSEYPRVAVGEGNAVPLPTTFPGCERAFCVPVKNVSRHCLRYTYELLGGDGWLQFDGTEGELAVNEVRRHTWTFTPPGHGSFAPSVRFTVHALRCDGPPTVVTVSCYGESHSAQLTASPGALDFGELPWGETAEQWFSVANPGPGPLCYRLSCRPPASDAELLPPRGVLHPGEAGQVSVRLTPGHDGPRCLEVLYEVRRSPDGDEVVPGAGGGLVRVRYDCIVPQLRVVDLNVSGQGALLTRLAFWRTMQINTWNEALERLRPGEVREAPLGLPQFPAGPRLVQVSLLLRGCSVLPVRWSLRRLPRCACRPEELPRAREPACPHRDLLAFAPACGTLQGGQEQVLRLTASYELQGCHPLSLSLLLSCDRELRLGAELEAHGPRRLSLAPDHLHLGVFLADPRPAAQCVWAYNHTGHALDYAVDESRLDERSGSAVVRCLNPRGTVPPNSALPLLFHVRPITLQPLQASVVLEAGGERLVLELSSEGTLQFSLHLPYMKSRLPEACRLPLEEVPVAPSLDHLVFGPVTTHTSAQRVFFLCNRSAATVFGYRWLPATVAGVVEGAVVPGQGLLRPGDKQACQLTLTTRGTAALLTLGLSCELLDLDERRRRSRAERLQRETAARCRGEFTICEDGVSYPEVRVEESRPPPVLHTAVSVTVHICDPRDVDAKIPLQQQLRLAPSPAVSVSAAPPSPPCLSAAERTAVTASLETILWELVHCDRWRWQLRELARHASTDSYGSYVVDEEDAARLAEESRVAPSGWLVTRTLRDVLRDVLQDELLRPSVDTPTQVGTR
ncbi:cilia- and flagella-associated protein 65-like [Bacillus rossius redtenbacheri]|uniref:cilia- and flagella-associated protein 65-like n=1 Tax=Bacillus rossius redtenbacheri TaxID=93214 RepID=UPI002FDD09A5